MGNHNLIEQVYQMSGLLYLSDLTFRKEWVKVVNDMIEQNEVKKYCWSEWEEFFRYVNSRNSFDENDEMLQKINHILNQK